MEVSASPKFGHSLLEVKGCLALQGQGPLGPARGYIQPEVAMRKSKFTEHQVVSILKQHEAGVKVADLCREHGISQATFYQWKAKYGGLDASQLKLMKELQEENSRLKRMYAELSMMHDSLKQVVEKKWGA